MLGTYKPNVPSALAAIERETAVVGFTMASDTWTGALLRTLAASKPGGSMLEIGTGTGLAAAWLLDGMTSDSRLLSIDNDEAVVLVARRHLARDRRVTFAIADGAAHLRSLVAERESFDLVFADSWPGKYTDLDAALELVKPGGLYVVDDMLPQPNWPDGHAPKVARLIEVLATHAAFRVSMLNWSTGIIVAAKVR